MQVVVHPQSHLARPEPAEGIVQCCAVFDAERKVFIMTGMMGNLRRADRADWILLCVRSVAHGAVVSTRSKGTAGRQHVPCCLVFCSKERRHPWWPG